MDTGTQGSPLTPQDPDGETTAEAVAEAHRIEALEDEAEAAAEQAAAVPSHPTEAADAGPGPLHGTASDAPSAVPTERPAPSPAAAPRPAAAPTPGALPRPAAMVTPAALHRPPRPAGEAAPAPEPVVEVVHPASDPHAFGRVAEDGTVFLTTPDGERAVGQWAAGDPEAGLAFFGRKYDDLVVEVDLADRRLADGRATPDQAAAVSAKVRAALVEPAFVGDLVGLRARLDALDVSVKGKRRAVAEQRAAAKVAALAARERLVAEAESLAGSTHWKVTGERFRTLLEEWKAAPRVDRAKEQELWKRFSHARSAFDKRRRQYFAQLDAQRKDAVAEKAAIVAEAEALATSTDWAGTARAYRALMDRWKASPRASRQDEDRLWHRFRAAQDAFFGARNATLGERDAGQKENLAAKEALISEAEALLPVHDLRAARASMRSIQERWEHIGYVPRTDRDRIEGRLKRVEEALRRAESDEWRRTNPEARARAEATVEQFRASVERLERQRDAAAARGDDRGVAEAESSLVTTRALLQAAQGALDEFTG